MVYVGASQTGDRDPRNIFTAPNGHNWSVVSAWQVYGVQLYQTLAFSHDIIISDFFLGHFVLTNSISCACAT